MITVGHLAPGDRLAKMPVLPSGAVFQAEPPSRHVGHQAACVSTELSTPQLLRSLLNVPFQSPIRALMLVHAARQARASRCGEFPTIDSSNSRPLGPRLSPSSSMWRSM